MAAPILPIDGRRGGSRPAAAGAERDRPREISNEELIEVLVMDWGRRRLPGEDAAVARAAHLARCMYAAGFSVSDSCTEAKRYLQNWSAHPSRMAAGDKGAADGTPPASGNAKVLRFPRRSRRP